MLQISVIFSEVYIYKKGSIFGFSVHT